MILYGIPDIRLFWSTDSGFLNQFKHDDSSTIVQYKVKNQNEINRLFLILFFWQPIDNFTNAKTKRTSHCYRIAYRAMDRNLTQKEVNELHKVIEEKVVREYHVKIR